MPEAEKYNMYLLESVKTGRIYLDETATCDIALTEKDALSMNTEKTGKAVSAPRRYSMIDIAGLCYGAGADKIRFHKDGTVQSVTLQAGKIKKAPYNHLTNQILCRAKQDANYALLYGLYEGYFFVPVRIEQSDDVDIYYVTAKHSRMETESYFIAFTTYEEYLIWASGQTGYKPLKIAYKSLRQIAGKHGWILNPKGNQLVLPNNILSQIDKRGLENA